MSADDLHVQPQHDRAEMITQADILSRLVQIQDRLYHIEQMLREEQERARRHDEERPPYPRPPALN